jgi:glucose uptake protein
VNVVLLSLMTILAWGTWIPVAQQARVANEDLRTFYATLGNLGFAVVVLLVHGAAGLAPDNAGAPFAGGLLWTAGSLCAFLATARIGLARAAGTWTPLNIAMGFVWGVALFGEFTRTTAGELALLGIAVVLIVAGLLLIVFARGLGGGASGRSLAGGLVAAVGAGIFWGTYFVPAEQSTVSAWVAILPLSVGMAVGGALLAARHRVLPRLPGVRDYACVLLAGVLWGTGNIGLLLLAQDVGTATSFTIAQLSLLVNGLVGVYVFRNPAPRTRAAAMTLGGVLLAGVGGVLLGNLR